MKEHAVPDRLIVVEGLSDKRRILSLLAEDVPVVCTNGTISPDRLDELLAPYDGWDFTVLVDADDSGERIRRLFRRDYPDSAHLYTQALYKEVATTPIPVLASILRAGDFKVRPLPSAGGVRHA